MSAISDRERDLWVKLPKAELLEIFMDFSAPLGVAYQRCLLFSKPDHALGRTVICFPRGATRAVSTLAGSGAELINDGTNAVIKGTGVRHRVDSLSTVYDDLALLPSAELVREVAAAAGFGSEVADYFLSFTGAVPRTPWLQGLVEQFFLRRVAQREPRERLIFFEQEIVRELIALVRQTMPGATAEAEASLSEAGTLGKAVSLIEANLFEPIALESLAKSSGTSVSTLARLFRSHLKATPLGYQRQRRLEEARRLLRSQRGLSVEQVAFLVGYQSPSAFCRSYRRQFGTSPQS